jgi:hypothetical protein
VLGSGVDVKQRDYSRYVRRKGGLSFSKTSFSPASGGTNIAVPAADSIQLMSPPFHITGGVKASGGTDADAKDWEAGFIQTVHVSKRVGHYKGSKTQTTYTDKTPNNVRDGVAHGLPWYDPDNDNAPPDGVAAFTKTNQELSVGLWDQPGTTFAWKTPDGKGKLDSSSGQDSFTAWMIARKKTAPNTIKYLSWQRWKMDYRATYNYASTGAKTVKKLKGRTSSLGSGTGRGSSSPTLTGAPANAQVSETWT